MDYKMGMYAFLLCGFIAAVTSITITSNGNSPKIKMIGGMMVDMEKGFEPMKAEETTVKTEHVKFKLAATKRVNNSTKLSINERYRRLIPYMTFYYANDLASPSTGKTKEVEIEKAQIIEAGVQREPKKIVYLQRNIPRYQGNRLTQHNIASANPTKVYYKGGVPVTVYPTQSTVSQHVNPLLSDYVVVNHGYESDKIVYKPIPQNPSVTFVPSTRKPYLDLNNEDNHNFRYYYTEKEPTPKYKLVPYEQTPPVKVNGYEHIHEINKKPIPVAVYVPKEPNYSKPRPARPHYIYNNVDPSLRRQPVIVSESYYEKQRPSPPAQPIIQGGFKPLLDGPQYTKEPYYSAGTPATILNIEPQAEQGLEHQEIHRQSAPVIAVQDNIKPNYYQYVVKQTSTEPPLRPNTISLATLLNTLQLNKSIPKPITKENVGTSIRTLLQVLNAMKATPQPTEVEVPVLSTPKPFVANKVIEVSKTEDEDVQTASEKPKPDNNADLHDEPYLADVDSPSQHLDDGPSYVGTSQRFPLPVTSDDEGGTPGRPGVDYPTLTVIPPTRFNCKTQRYKGFFADPETRCQVWHYCDLNGGQASFLCPNGTIFSQAGLTCDWWFNVRCASTTQLYVLNESLYKYILPHSPKFPEDYSGPLVDKYLTLKFKEMEEEFKKNKNKKSKTEKSESTEDSNEAVDSKEMEESTEIDRNDKDKVEEKIVDEASVILESPGTSGQVERLQDD